MKKMIMLLMVAMMSVTSVMASNKKACDGVKDSAQLVFKQTISFEDDSEVVVYYVKQSDAYRVYSTEDLNKMNPKKLLGVKSFNVEKTDDYQGNCYLTCSTLQEVMKTANELFNKYKEYLP